jgi:hypothetical protein
VLCDHEAMSRWAGFERVSVIRAGRTDRGGVGAERLMSGSLGVLVEQIVGVEPQRQIRYRAIEGAPFHYHRGEINLREQGGETEVHWQIGFRGKAPGLGRLMRAGMRPLLERTLERGLKPYVESLAAGR